MGTKGKCIKCGKEKWINTTKLKNIHSTIGIRPNKWISSNYVCSECKHRQRLLKESDVSNIINQINDFIVKCKTAYSGLLQNKNSFSDINKAIKDKMMEICRSVGINSDQIEFITYKTLTIGMVITMPIVSRFTIIFI